MRIYWLVSLIVTAFLSVPCLASAGGFYDAQSNTWNATHVVVVENGRVAESWMGDFKVGDVLPEGDARFTRIPVPGPDPFRERFGEKLPSVSGKRMVLFLAYVPQEGKDPQKRIWMGADAPGLGYVSATAVAWVEGDRVYSVYQPINPGDYALRADGTVAGLRQRVDFGLALRTQFAAAKADKNCGRRAERLAFLTPYVAQFAGYYGESDCFEELEKCGKPAVQYLVPWATEEKGKYWGIALSTLSRLGDDGFDAMAKILDDEAKFWKAVADDLGPTEWIDQTPRTDIHAWHRPYHLRRVLEAAQAMKLSARNKERLQAHAGLKELDKLLAKPRMKPEKSDMERAHEIIQDILADKSRVRK